MGVIRGRRTPRDVWRKAGDTKVTTVNQQPDGKRVAALHQDYGRYHVRVRAPAVLTNADALLGLEPLVLLLMRMQNTRLHVPAK